MSTPSPMSSGAQAGLDLRVEVFRAGPGVGCLRVSGELDFLTAPRLRRVLLAEIALLGAESALRAPRLELDLSGVWFCSAAGLAVLLEAQVDAIRTGVGLTLSRTSRAIVRVLTLSGLGQALPSAPGLSGPSGQSRS